MTDPEHWKAARTEYEGRYALPNCKESTASDPRLVKSDMRIHCVALC